MKIEIHKATVEFKSNDKYYEKEESGKKCNTARELTYEQILEVEHCTHIKIVSVNGQRSFERKLTDISVVDDVIRIDNTNRKLVVFSWHPNIPLKRETIPEFTRIPRVPMFDTIKRCG